MYICQHRMSPEYSLFIHQTTWNRKDSVLVKFRIAAVEQKSLWCLYQIDVHHCLQFLWTLKPIRLFSFLFRHGYWELKNIKSIWELLMLKVKCRLYNRRNFMLRRSEQNCNGTRLIMRLVLYDNPQHFNKS